MMLAERSHAIDASYAPVRAVRGGIVSRRGLFERLDTAARVTQVSALAGSGKTYLLRSWIAECGLADCAAWVPVQAAERDPQRFWISVLDALRGTIAGSKLVRPLTGAPDLDGWAVIERLLEDLEPLEDSLWLVIDDVHELRSADALAQLELLVMRAPATLRFVLLTRREMRLGLHRLRLEGELTEIRAGDLQFSLDEARALFEAAGVELPEPVLAALVRRTEGWVAGLRLAALSLAGHPDPKRFAAGFSGSERTVAQYLLAEVLDQAARALRGEVEPAAGVVLHQARGMLELARGHDGQALAAFQAAERLAGLLVAAHPRSTPMRAHMLQTLIRLGDAERAGQALAGLDETARGELHNALAALRLAEGDPQAASVALAPVLDGSAPVTNLAWASQALWLEAIARDTLGDPAAAGRALEQALDLVEPDGAVLAFVLHPAPELLERHARRGTSHAALIAEIVSLLASGGMGGGQPPMTRGGLGGIVPPRVAEPLSGSESRVLRYLPTNLSAPEIAAQLSVSVNTVRTHVRHVYEKLGTHGRAEAVERARALGLLAPSSRRP
jgi:DNA-binding CsgD family transcriptional regulator